MLSSIGAGSLNVLFQPNLSPVKAGSASGSQDSVSASSSADTSGSGQSSGSAAGYGGEASSSSSAQTAVTASQAVAPVSQSASEARDSYGTREAGSDDSDRRIAAATQRERFRAQLLDRIGQDAENAGPSSILDRVGVSGSELHADVEESALDYSY